MKKNIIILFLSCLTVLTVHAQAAHRSGVRDDIASKGKGSKPTPSRPTRPKSRMQEPGESDKPTDPIDRHSGFHFERKSSSESSSQSHNGFRFESTSTKQKGKHHGSKSVRTGSRRKGKKSPANEKSLSTDPVSANQSKMQDGKAIKKTQQSLMKKK